MNTLKPLLPLLAIFIALSCGEEYRFNTNWECDTGHDTATVEFQYKNHIYVSAGEYLTTGSPNHVLYCLDMQSGETEWKFDSGKDIIIQEIALVENAIFLRNTTTTEIWINALTGKKLGKTPSIPAISKTPRNHTFNGNQVIALSGDESAEKPAAINCVNPAGKTIWSYEVPPLLNVKEPYEVNFSFLLHGNDLILATYDGKVKSIHLR